MTDEQPVPIYLSPEEELTSVRERLEKTQARRIILVIPPQTQLRSHVGWRLIHARMRELGKDLLVISPDRQVRAVARAAGFRVAESQESPSNRPRLGSSSTRPGNINTRGAARSRLGSSRGGPESRASQQGSGRRPTPNPDHRPLTPLPPSEHAAYDDEITLERPDRQELEPKESQPIAPPPTLFREPEAHKRSLRDFNISTTPSVRPSVPGHEDEDDDASNAYYDDYNTAKRIRESASASGGSAQTRQDKFSSERERGSRGSAASRWDNDPFVYMEDEQQPLPLPEQKGSMPGLFDEIGTNVPDISDRSTEIMQSEIEDLGDMGAITPLNRTSLPKPREQGQRSRRPSGQTRQHSPRSPRPGSQNIDDDDELLALPDRPTQMGRPSRGLAGSPRPSQSLRSGQRPSQTLKSGQAPQPAQRPSQSLRSDQAPQPAQRPSQTLKSGQAPQPAQRPSRSLQAGPRPSQTLRPNPAPQVSQRARPVSALGPRTPVLSPSASTHRQPISRQRPTRRNKRGLAIFLTILILLLLVVGSLLYFVPTATVTISLQAQDYSQVVQLHASAHPQPGAPGAIQAQTLEHDFSASGQGTASGQTRVSDTHAQGLVTFTNNGSADVTIPTGTIITTQSGISFATNAEAFVPHGHTQPAVPVTAQQIGIAGNVPANSITSIPASSVASIAQDNHTGAATIHLTVTNSDNTKGGEAKNVPAVTKQDLQALERMLHKDLQQQITSWLAAQTPAGDLHGTPMPNALNSANPLPAEQFSGTPGAGQAASSGTFPGTLTLHIKVLVARAATIKAAAGTLMQTAVPKAHPTFMLATQLPITLANEKGTPAPDGNSLAISAKATGAMIKQTSIQDLSNTLAGKSIGQATSNLQSSLAQAGVQHVQISVTPAFLGFMPWQAGRIQVILQPVQPPPPNHVSNS